MTAVPNYFDTGMLTNPSPDHKVCEDVVFTLSGDNLSVAALADGIGAAKFARETAEEVSQLAARRMIDNFEGLYEADDRVVTEWLRREILDHMTAYVNGHGESSFSRYGSTLICCAFHEDGRYLIVHCGDGAVLRVRTGGIEVLSTGGVKRYHNLPSNVLDRTMEWKVVRGNEEDTAAFLLTSDGTEEDIFGNGVSLPLTAPIYHSMIHPAAFEGVFSWYIEKCRARNFRDDISFGWICDRRKTGNVVRKMPSEMRKFMIGGLSNPATVNRLCSIYEFAAARDGISLAKLSHKMGYRKTAYARRRLTPFLSRGLIRMDKGIVRF